MSRHSLIFLLLIACSPGGEPVAPSLLLDGDADTDADADADTDADTDTDVDTDNTDTGDTATTTGCIPTKLTTGVALGAPPAIGEEYGDNDQIVACVESGVRIHGYRQIWYTRESDGAIYCLFTFEFESTAVRNDCAECEWAFDVDWGFPYEDGTTQCPTFHPAADLVGAIPIAMGMDESGFVGAEEMWWWAENSDWRLDSLSVQVQMGFIPDQPLDAEFDGLEWNMTYTGLFDIDIYPPAW